ncbi:MAG: low molecular weight phosphotyrosine protein phosphatase [Firmicutes bacterium]|nr:low molecular weight phosphotyrosine protein phosphatase [Bacillota bacterium]
MIKVLFVCHGNICRSTMAQFVFQDMVNKNGVSDKFYIDSAATSREEIGNTTHWGTVNMLKNVGVPVLPHKAKQITKKDYDEFDYIIAMDSNNIRNLNRLLNGDPEGKVYKLLAFAGSGRDIADPWYTGNFDVTYDDIVEGCTALLKRLI